MENIKHLIQLLQLLISPIILISGVGLLLLSFTNRLGRVIDRSRYIVKEIKDGKDDDIKRIQIPILYKRSRILRSALTSISFTILCASMMILLLFLGYFTQFNVEIVFISFFILAIIGLIISIILFMWDVTVSLKALKIQAGDFL